MTIGATEAHMNAMKKVNEVLCVYKVKRVVIGTNKKWNCDPEFELEVVGRSDSDIA